MSTETQNDAALHVVAATTLVGRWMRDSEGLAESLGLTAEKIAALGDWMNDAGSEVADAVVEEVRRQRSE